jgi:hypothetical protein
MRILIRGVNDVDTVFMDANELKGADILTLTENRATL